MQLYILFLYLTQFLKAQDMKIKNIQEVKYNNQRISDKSANLELFVKWDPWGCCSACCCPEVICKKFANIENCESVKSIKSRYGVFGIRKFDKMVKLKNSNLEKTLNGSDGLDLESLVPYTTEYDFINSKMVPKLREMLNINADARKVFELKNCEGDIQKMDCWELAKCKYGSSNMLPAKETQSIEEIDVCENATIFVLRQPYTILSVHPKRVYRLQIDQAIGDGNVISINYTLNNQPVEKLDHINDCERQVKNVFIHPNGVDLIVRLSEQDLRSNSKVVAGISYENPSRIEIVAEMVPVNVQRAQIPFFDECQKPYDAIIIGGGHNGLTAAAYLAKAGKTVCVLEKRHVIGGAAVTEEIVPGFRFSRASYLLSLLRPVVIQELGLKKFGLKYHIRDPSSFTPIRGTSESLLLGMSMVENQREIAKFSAKDAEAYPKYEHFISQIVNAVEPLMDYEPIDLQQRFRKILPQLYLLYKTVQPLGLKNAVDFYELMTAPISKIMNKWFESDVLKATLGTDGVIGLAASPMDAGTGYVLLHHVIGGLDEHQGAWGYVYGGMGAVSMAIADCAKSYGAEIHTEQEVREILLDGHVAKGVRLRNGREIRSHVVLSNATPHVTFNELVEKNALPVDFRNAVNQIDYTSPVTKINVAVKELPNFVAKPNIGHQPMPHHQTTIHMNCENMQIVDKAVADFRNGVYSKKPVIEMTIPSSVDRTIVDGDGHVVLLFTQYTPFNPVDGSWNEEKKDAYAKHVFAEIDAYAPNFSSSIIGYDILTPPDIQQTFGITGGNIFHGSMGLDQLYMSRPIPKYSNYSTPIQSLFLCGSGSHPGGGVTGAPGRLGALHALKHF